MARKSTPLKDYKSLFALSGNICAFPGCMHPIVNQKGQLIAEVCHIEAANKGGERYNPDMSDDERASFDNLLLMCHRHHIETNDVREYTVEKLKKIKCNHEKLYHEKTYEIKEQILCKILDDAGVFWAELERENINFLDNECMGLEVDTTSDLLELCDELEEKLQWIYSLLDSMYNDIYKLPKSIVSFMKKNGYDTEKIENIPYYENQFENMHWESYNLGYENAKRKIENLLILIKLRYLLKLSEKNENERQQVVNLKKMIIMRAKSITYCD